MPHISIIIPTYNRAKTVLTAVDSVLAQTYQDIELFVIDDGSTDETAQKLSGVKDKRLHLNYQENKGVSAARNKGLQKATGEWIAFLDSDDAWDPRKLHTQVDYHQQNPDSLISQTQETWIRNGKFVNPMKKHQKPTGYIFPQSLQMCAITPSSVFIHQTVLDDVGWFDEALPACEDYDLWLRITKTYPVRLIDQALLIKTGGHADQLSAKFIAMDRFRIFSLFKLILSGKLSETQKKEVCDVCQKKVEILSSGIARRGQDPSDLIQLANTVIKAGDLFESLTFAAKSILLDDSRYH